MTLKSRIDSLETVVKGYIVGYLLAIAGLIAVAFVGLEGPVTDTPHRFFIAGISVFTLAFAGQVVAFLRGRAPVRRVLDAAIAPELVALVLLVAALKPAADVGFAVALSVPMFYISAVRRRDSWFAAGLCAAAYIAGHGVAELTGARHQVYEWAAIGIQAGALVYLGVALALNATHHAEHESQIQAAKEANEHLTDRLQRRLTELHAVSEITEIIHSTLDFDTIGPVVIEIIQKVIDLPSCSLFVIDRSKSETLFSTSTFQPGSAPVDVSYDVVSGRGNDEHFSCISVFDHKTMMVVFCAETEALQGMSAEDKLVLQAVASELVVAVENSQLYKLTRTLAITDELTGLTNYRYLQQRLDEEVGRARRYHKHVSLVMLDVDDFKQFNDTHGHIAGDEALAELARVLRSCVREVDVVCRYGGEEFSVVLPETDATGAYVVAEKIREGIESFEFADAAGERGVSLTASVGVASYPAHAYDKETLLKQADDALYRAKGSGKNRVRSPHRKLTPPGEVDEAAPAGKGVGA
ncbi:MAG: GGDEF domain-containing protein [Actinobacteria bacterium]|nr:MAG: GGDEF domain-containing protein [Actinomycetota bacterium]